ncbi:MAG: hypothetical protein NXI18_21685 [Alphaproteobacteria bacterium]|nr:hypothetical protein [Alphaproteobacteria bacterium]
MSFDTPIRDSDGHLRWRVFESHHFESWLEVRQHDEAISGAFRSHGWGGPREIPVLAPRIDGDARAICLAAVDALMND